MKLTTLTQLLALLAISPLAACSAAPSDDAGEAPDDEVDSAEDELVSGVSTFFTVRRDTRRCLAPLCGGYWVSRANATTTRCADGTYDSACYVAELNLASLDVSATLENELRAQTKRLVLRGSVGAKTFGSFGNLGAFRATEAWRAPADGAATGTFYKLGDSNIRCVVAPCPSIAERKLNSTAKQKNIVDVDLAAAPGSNDAKAAALAEIHAPGLIVAGANALVDGLVLNGSQFYTRVRGVVAAGGVCGAGDTCAAGTLCCYPCGIQGCQNQCVSPDPRTGGCRMDIP